MEYLVRRANMKDYARILEIYAAARQFMALHGNPDQWGTYYPPESQVLQDIHEKKLFVAADVTGIHGVFFFSIEDDPCYHIIEEGNWHCDDPYGVLHRVAGDGSGGILKASIKFAESQIAHLRIDTHHDNKIMQKALEKQGFTRCGIVYMSDGSRRIAYDRISI